MTCTCLRYTFEAALGLVLLFCFTMNTCAGTAATTPRRPNIVLIVADDLGYGELGIQGYTHDIPTPHIDSLAENGVRFTQGYVSAPQCSPSRAGLLTGRYQQRFGHEFNPAPGTFDRLGLPRSQENLAERLKTLGYRTGMFGKWHLGNKREFMPLQRGFDEFFGSLGGMRPYLGTAPRNPLLRGSTTVDEPEYLTDALAREAVAFLQNNRGKPFFLYLPFNAVHAPLQATETYLGRFTSIKDPRRRTFAAMTSALDDAVGLILRRLEDLKLGDDTLIFFISDNGGSTPATTSGNGPLRGHKGQLFEGGIRIPYLIQWKKHLPAGKVYEYPVSSLDIHPTAIVAAGGAIADQWHLDGVDLLPYLLGKKTTRPHETLYWRKGKAHAIRDGDWKLLFTQRLAKPALFDLAKDIGETQDLSLAMPEKVAKLTAEYDAWNALMAVPAWQDKNVERARALQPNNRRFRSEEADD